MAATVDTGETPCEKESISTPAETNSKSVVKLETDAIAVEAAAGSKRGPNEGADAVAEQTEAKRPKQEENDSDGDDEKTSGKFQKRMMAIQFGYVGTGYAGLQKYVTEFCCVSQYFLGLSLFSSLPMLNVHENFQ